MGIPEITHLQYLVLSSLALGERTGADLRDELARHDVQTSGPAFYQMMARLEDAGFVKGRYQQLTVEGQAIKVRRYRILGAGCKACVETRRFYQQSVLEAGRFGACVTA